MKLREMFETRATDIDGSIWNGVSACNSFHNGDMPDDFQAGIEYGLALVHLHGIPEDLAELFAQEEER